MNIHNNRLIEKGLKVTPQRMAVLEAILHLKNHPSADNIIEYIWKVHPNISVATVYKVLDAFVEKELIRKVKTEKGIMRYDAVTESHHHLYCSISDRIEDYVDHDLNAMLEQYFQAKKIPGFNIEDIKLQIIGKFETK
jgi:Fur family transcriptional regulator, peroxide stress response regulator